MAQTGNTDAAATLTHPPSAPRVRVWDPLIRGFHWAVVALVGLQWASGDLGLLGMDWHIWGGYAVLFLLLARLLWGVVGTPHARFARFVRGPLAVWDYGRELLAGRHQATLGHNPMGGWSVMALMGLLAGLVLSGLMMSDEVLFEGPWYSAVGPNLRELAAEAHELLFYLLLGFVGLHIAAIVGYALMGERLLAAMVHGRKPEPAQMDPAERIERWPWVRMGLVLAVAAGLAALLVVGGEQIKQPIIDLPGAASESDEDEYG